MQNNYIESFFLMFYNASYYTLIVIAVIFILFILGRLFLSPLNPFNKKNNFIASVFYGLLILIFMVAIIKTAGKTVFLIPLIGLLSIRFFYKVENIEFYDNFKLNHIVENAIICFIVVFLWVFRFWNFQVNEIIVNLSDWLHYAKVSNKLWQFGIENLNSVPQIINYKQLQPYHYGELWFVSFFSNLFKINSVITYSIIYGSVFEMLIIILSKNVFNSKKRYFAFFPIIFIGGIEAFDKYHLLGDFVTNSSYWCLDSFLRVKMIITTFFALIAIFVLNKKKETFFYLVLSLFPIFNYGLVPFMVLFVFFSALYTYYFKLDKKNLLILLITLIYIIVFYNIIYESKESATNLKLDFSQYFELYFLKSTIFHTISSILGNIKVYLFIIPLFLFYIKNYNLKFELERISQYNYVIVPIAISSIISIFASGFFFWVAESFQITSNPLSILMILLTIFLLTKLNYFQVIIFYLLYMTINFSTFHREFTHVTSNKTIELLKNSKICECNLYIYNIPNTSSFQKELVYGNYDMCLNKNDQFYSLNIY